MTSGKRSVSPRTGRLYAARARRSLAIALLAAALAASAPRTAPAGPGPTHNISILDSVYDGTGTIFVGSYSGYGAAYSISAAGDVNGDGLADIIVGVPGFNLGSPIRGGAASGSGGAFVVFGQKDHVLGPQYLDDVLAGSGGFFIASESNVYGLGVSVAQAGDFNGDGFGDVVVGTPFANTQYDVPSYCLSGYYNPDTYEYVCEQYGGGYTITYNNVGRAYVIFGKPDTNPVSAAALSSGIGGFAIDAAFEYSQLGSSVSGAGDLNGDGFSDVIIGANNFDAGSESRPGAAFVLFGGSTAPASPVYTDQVGSSVPGFPIHGEPDSAAGRAGQSVASCGDVNGDGLADVIVGAPYAQISLGARSAREVPFSPFGKAYVVFGKSDSSPVELDALAAGAGSGFAIIGPHPYSLFGISVSGAGDFNGDGFSDFVVGAPGTYDPGATGKKQTKGGGTGSYYLGQGAAFIGHGKPDSALVSSEQFLGGYGGFIVFGDPNTYYGSAAAGLSVSLAGDVNGDGLTDVIIGEPFGDPPYSPTRLPVGGPASGNAFVVYGKTTLETINTPAIFADPAQGFGITGFLGYAGTGFSVSEAGDFDGDGLSDLIVGTPGLFGPRGGPVPRGEERAPGGPFPGFASVIYSPGASQPSATYLSHAKQGAAPRKGVSDDSDITFPDSRAFLAFAAGDAVSTETVTLTRSNSSISNLNHPADVLWQITTDRDNFSTATVTLRYVDSEVAGAGLSELGLTVFTAEDPAGPWDALPTTRDPARNHVLCDTTHFSYFALGQVDDGDGVDSGVESLVPNFGGAPGTGDGNGDAIPDADQPHVTSFPNAVNGEFVTLEAPLGTQISQIETRTAPVPLPPGADFPIGLVGFHLTGNLADAPDATTVLLHLQSPPTQPITGYNKFSLRDGYIPFTAPIGASNVGGTAISPTTIQIRLLDSTSANPLTVAESGDADSNADIIYDPGGPTTGGPLLVSLASFTATTTTDGVRLEWLTLAEFDNAGFNLYRFDDGLQRLNATIIPAAGLDGSGAAYSYLDDYPVAPGENRLYYLEDVDLNGTRTLHGPISPSTTTTSVKNWDLF